MFFPDDAVRVAGFKLTLTCHFGMFEELSLR